MKIREATPADAGAIKLMIRELVAYEGISAELNFTVEQLAAALTGTPPKLHALVAEDAEGVAGFVTYTIDFMLWTGGDILRIDDLFVRERARGAGAGTALMARIAEIAIDAGVPCRWEIEVPNARAQRFYATLGAEIRDKKIARWSLMAMRAALAKLSRSST
ncbi:MAG: GNAT family N-acetyltransferase [Rhodospirillaceae bacterium]|jgi:GNAT superfamily N-acetyltransferase|nr:GNAT family N-acetyltransferase [Rhodospirillaceae bacterium]